MKHTVWLWIVTFSLTYLAVPATVPAEPQTVAEQLSILDERLSKLRADVDALQFNQQQIQQDIKQLQGQLDEVRRAGPSASANDIQTLEARIRAIDAARENDKKVILDQLAKELAALGSPHSGAPASGSPPTAAGGNEHVVQKGETLTSIAKIHGVTVAELRKANNLTSDEIRVGQKLVIPK
ncbi:MAG TPA: LysM peptidoglycan-binding domain-containing protein [Verrucomicrobiae bacterium]|nr:LysM peptidoglycan-binding domain-containing protein [Verrucomicrobiae bacterium]